MGTPIEATATVDIKKIERVHAAKLAIAQTEIGAARSWHLPVIWLLGAELAATVYFSQVSPLGVSVLIGMAFVTAVLAQVAFQQSVRLNRRLEAVLALLHANEA